MRLTVVIITTIGVDRENNNGRSELRLVAMVLVFERVPARPPVKAVPRTVVTEGVEVPHLRLVG